MPTGRADAVAGVVNGILYVAGGVGCPDIGCGWDLDTVEAYDPVTNAWKTKAAMPTKRMSPAAGVINGVLYVVGGFNNPDGRQAVLEGYWP
jgi:N-acetylneuraminic acid mutarotase